MLSSRLKIIVFSGLVLMGCTQNQNDESIVTQANPASTKCIADGYQLIKVPTANGVSSELWCYNPATKQQCEEWDYFRANCHLK